MNEIDPAIEIVMRSCKCQQGLHNNISFIANSQSSHPRPRRITCALVNSLKPRISSATMVVATATGTIPCPLKAGLIVDLACPSGGSAAYSGVVDMIPG